MKLFDRFVNPRNKLSLVIGLQFICVIGVVVAGVTAYALTLRSNVASRHIEQTLEFTNQVQTLLAQVQSAETGQRGYLLSRDPKYLDPYKKAVDQIEHQIVIVREYATRNPDQRQLLTQLDGLITKRMEELARTVELAKKGEFAAARRIIASDEGEELMTRIRRIAEEFRHNKNRQLRIQQAVVRLTGARLFSAILLALLLVILFGAAAVVINVRHVSAIRESETMLRNANLLLEARVRERTSELEKVNRDLAIEKERAEAMLKDLNHRVGNSLQLVSAFLGMQEADTTSPDAKKALAAARARVMAIASTQRRLRLGADNETCDVNELLGDLVEDLKATVPSDHGLDMTYRGEAMNMPVRDAVSLGVIVGELVTNSLKYAFPDTARGAIRVVLTPPDGHDSARLEVIDNGVGPGEVDGRRSGLGSRIVTTLAESIGGTIEWAGPTAGEIGTRVAVTFPAERVAAGA